MSVHKQTLIWGTPLVIALAACATATTATAGAVPLGESFSLAVGESSTIDGEDLELTFDGVTGDNRCPKGVQCIVAGAATVVLTAESGGEARELTFEVPPGGSASERLDDLEITIARVDPQAVAGKRIEPEDYVVTVVVEQPAAAR